MSNELGFHLWMRKARLMGPPICTLTIQQGRAGLLTVHGNKPRSITHYHTHTHIQKWLGEMLLAVVLDQELLH